MRRSGALDGIHRLGRPSRFSFSLESYQHHAPVREFGRGVHFNVSLECYHDHAPVRIFPTPTLRAG